MDPPITSSGVPPPANARPSAGRVFFGFRALAEAVATIAAPMLGRRGLADSRVGPGVRSWANAGGAQPAGWLGAGACGGALHVRVSSGAQALNCSIWFADRADQHLLRLSRRRAAEAGACPLPTREAAPPPSLSPRTGRAEALVAGTRSELRRFCRLGKQLYARSK
jgi:hypothetical protein